MTPSTVPKQSCVLAQPLSEAQSAVVWTLSVVGVGLMLLPILAESHYITGPLNYGPTGDLFADVCRPMTWGDALATRIYWVVSSIAFGASPAMAAAGLCHLKNALDEGWSKRRGFLWMMMAGAAFGMPAVLGCA